VVFNEKIQNLRIINKSLLWIKALNMKLLNETNLNGKTVLLRVDLNVPVKGKKIADQSKIVLIKQTVAQLLKKNNKVFLLSHFGRPKGEVLPSLSLKSLSNQIEKILGMGRVIFLDNFINQSKMEKDSIIDKGDIFLLENIRFHKEEEENDENFSKKLSECFDVYINDSFSASHRTHASVVGITKFLPSYAGLLFEKELKNLKRYVENPRRPCLAIIGGSKVSTKISLIKNIIIKLDYLVIGGGMANTFLAADGFQVGSSRIEKNYFNEIYNLKKIAIKHNCKIILPVDALSSVSLKNAKRVRNCELNNILKKESIFDIGDASINEIVKIISEVQTVLWNGPLGAFEYAPFDKSTKDIAKHLSKCSRRNNLDVIVGGGDTLAALKDIDVIKNFTYVSTSGGAFLHYLEGKSLPGIKALK
tara:strand:+ start:766 stop:2022 length:1257 start_codon:yes stop_codon:yes gene_type:complete